MFTLKHLRMEVYGARYSIGFKSKMWAHIFVKALIKCKVVNKTKIEVSSLSTSKFGVTCNFFVINCEIY